MDRLFATSCSEIYQKWKEEGVKGLFIAWPQDDDTTQEIL
jgi:hypothetical protein